MYQPGSGGTAAKLAYVPEVQNGTPPSSGHAFSHGMTATARKSTAFARWAMIPQRRKTVRNCFIVQSPGLFADGSEHVENIGAYPNRIAPQSSQGRCTARVWTGLCALPTT